jgi:hypothetical protein
MKSSEAILTIVGFFILLTLIISAPALFLFGVISKGGAWLLLLATLALGVLYVYLTTEDFALDVSDSETVEIPRRRAKLKRL